MFHYLSVLYWKVMKVPTAAMLLFSILRKCNRHKSWGFSKIYYYTSFYDSIVASVVSTSNFRAYTMLLLQLYEIKTWEMLVVFISTTCIPNFMKIDQLVQNMNGYTHN
jgi:hypothetical protein